jgi:hypothetical protein
MSEPTFTGSPTARSPMSGLSKNDPPPVGRRSGPRVVLVVAIAVVVIIVVALHVLGVVGPGSR